MGAAWGAPVASVEVQIRQRLLAAGDPRQHDSTTARRFAWRFWSMEWAAPTSGEHTVRSRAIDLEGNFQPAQDDASFVQQEDLLGE
jgi:hypothetical protein